jgi:uncharacterized LabA/DUF88 family protein
MRTTIYVDGFNLYYRALKGTRHRWVDLHALSRQLLHADNTITRIRYFTARVKPNGHKPGQHVRQDAYLQAIAASTPCLQIHEGHFYRHVVRMPVARPVPGGPKTVEVIKTEEKGSDVNLAVHLVNDACIDAFDVALVISNDSDLAEAIRIARSKGKAVGVANPNASQRMNAVLYDAASFTRRIEEKHLRAAQLPSSIPGIGVHKPPHW